VAVRCSALSLSASGNNYLEPGQWQGSFAYRWLHSDRHFRGGREEANRQAEGSEVINDVHTFDLTATYTWTKRFNTSLTLPFVHADRSSKYEHLGNRPENPRFSTSAGGLGDLRLTGSLWMLNPDEYPNGNFSLGLGVKAPTGDYNATDTFHKSSGEVTRPVDQSIQPGDGGWGILMEVQAFQKLFDRTFAYLTGIYLANPRTQNGTETPNSRPGNITLMSVPDAYLGRIGLTYAVWPEQGLSLSLGGRIEGVPVRDLIGGGDAYFRRPGYAIAIEPGVTWHKGNNLFTLSVPVALERNRERSVRDLQTGGHGDAAFADFVILASFSRRF
jgi:hypothetical protein